MKLLLAAFLASSLVACAGAPSATRPPVIDPNVPRGPVDGEARARFDAAMAVFVHHDETNDWDAATCASVAAMFDDAAAASARRNVPFVHATYDAGLAFQRCNDTEKARAHFEKAAKDDPTFDPALARLALYRYRQEGNADAAIDALERAVAQGHFKNVSALVDLASMQMSRDAAKPAPGCKDDMECAKLNLQRALAIDDTYVPASNQLALYYLLLAKKRAGTSGGIGAAATIGSRASSARARQISTPAAMQKRADVQQLELAALVCSQAIAKHPGHATIHNTAGLIMHELGQVNGAVAEFAQAAKLDPRFFEAHMNYAAVNLSFRGFEQARAAYGKALELRPGDYDAHLGLALALRGPLTGSETDYVARLAAVQRELDAAKMSDGDRPDAWFNEGILTQEFEARAGASELDTLRALDRAQVAFERFIDKARGKTEYEAAVSRAKERLQDIDTARTFIKAPQNASKTSSTTSMPPASSP